MENRKVSKKDWLTSLLLCWFAGLVGAHRFYTGKIFTGLLILNGTLISVGLLTVNVYLGLTALVIVGGCVVNDFLNIALKNFSDIHGHDVVADTAINK